MELASHHHMSAGSAASPSFHLHFVTSWIARDGATNPPGLKCGTPVLASRAAFYPILLS